MKKIILGFLVFVSCASKGQTNVYHPFPDSSAVWNFDDTWYCWLWPGDVVIQNYSITFSNDTVIGGQTYHKLQSPYMYYATTTCGSGATYLNVYKGAIRQDSSIKKVFIVPPSESTEELLYDFTMQIGDTVRGYTERSTGSFPDIVRSVDSILVGSSYRKRWFINQQYHIYLIEGIGSTYGLLEQSPSWATDALQYQLTCFQQNGFALYPSTSNSCGLITSVNQIEKTPYQINIFPNPSASSITIDFGNANIKEFQLTDLLGKTILKQTLVGQTHFEIKELKTGTYILTLIDNENRRINRKIISSQ